MLCLDEIAENGIGSFPFFLICGNCEKTARFINHHNILVNMDNIELAKMRPLEIPVPFHLHTLPGKKGMVKLSDNLFIYRDLSVSQDSLENFTIFMR